MARLWSSGFELNSTTANVEFTGITNTPTIQTTTVRSGTYAGRCNPTAAIQAFFYQVANDATTGTYFARVYIRAASFPSSGSTAVLRALSAAAGLSGDIRLTSGGVLQLFQRGNTQVGSDSSAISLNTWYRIELKIAATDASTGELRGLIDGVEFAGSASAATDRVNTVRFGCVSSTTADIYLDDIAINDATGSFQNTYPGAGEIIHLRPNASGDVTDWSLSTGTDHDALVSEVTPDDVTTYVFTTTTNQIEEFNLDDTPAPLASDDTINCVQVGFRGRRSATETDNVVLRIKASASGTTEESANFSWPNSTTWLTNASAAPRNYQLTLYDLPGASTTAWTKADLDTAQIGAKPTGTLTAEVQMTSIWLLVDHKPAAGGATLSIAEDSTDPSKSGWRRGVKIV